MAVAKLTVQCQCRPKTGFCMWFRRRRHLEHFSSDFDGTLLAGFVDVSLCNYKRREKMPWCVCVVIPTTLDRDGLLNSHNDCALNQWQLTITAVIKQACKSVFVGRISSITQHELMYYVETRDKALDGLKKLANSATVPHFIANGELDPEWLKADYYLESLRPGPLILD